MNKEIKFTKYKKRGDYHWQGLKKNILIFNAFLEARYKMILAQLPNKMADEKIIDIGCGDGVLDYLIKKEKGGKIMGVDSAKEAIKMAKEKFKKYKYDDCKFQTGDGYHLMFQGNTFDYAICADVIEHVKDPKKILREIRRVLKPKGTVIISSVIKLNDKPEDQMHAKEYSTKELTSLMKEFFSKIINYQSHPQFLKNLYQFNFKVERYQPQPLRYLINFISIFLGFNLFSLRFGKLTCQTLVAEK